MKIENIPVPEIYKESQDFRFFLKWFCTCLEKLQYDTENLLDLYDPQRCPSDLLWLLADTIGFKFDSRLCPAFNRLVLLYFMSMIYNRGSKTGVTLAAEVNLAQFNIELYGQENEILYDRLEDTNIPVNAVSVTEHTEEGYIDVVYASTREPINACIEYVRPLGMYLFEHAGVTLDARTKISVDARLANMQDLSGSIGPTHVGHYRRSDYASMQRMIKEQGKDMQLDTSHTRNRVWYRNSEAEGDPEQYPNPGYRTLYSLQLSNNEHIVRSLLVDPNTGQENPPIFDVGFEPQDLGGGVTKYPTDIYFTEEYRSGKVTSGGVPYKESTNYKKPYNLQYDKKVEESLLEPQKEVYTDENKDSSIFDGLHPKPAVNPIMTQLGDALDVGEDSE